MLYGYKEKDALNIKKALDVVHGQDVTLISGSGKEEETVGDILEKEGAEAFQAMDFSILMFLNFDDGMIDKTLKAFPKDVKRPIFCTTTERNVNWKLSDLIKDLLEEHDFFMKKGKGGV